MGLIGVVDWLSWGRLIIISTHTPVKGVTSDRDELLIRLDISTHTPVKGVTQFF